jgi:hypothetical protein
MENWKMTLKSEIESILETHSNPKEEIDGKYRQNISGLAFSNVAEELVEHLVQEYGFSYINPDTVSELDNLKKDLELKKCQTCKNLNQENNYCKNLERFVNVEFCCIEYCL